MTNYTYVVTGCTGYIGNVFAKKLLSLGCRVVGLARSEKKVKQVFPDGGIEIVYGDITKAEDVERLFVGEKPFIVLHTAAVVTIGEGDLRKAEAVTVQGAKNIVDACCRFPVKKLLHISSTEVLPEETDEELQNYLPDTTGMKLGYARFKRAADAVVLSAVRERGLDASLLMFAAVLGAGDYSNGHMGQMLKDFVEGKLPASIKGGYNVTDVGDVAKVLPAVIQRSKAGESYVFAGERSTINEILQAASLICGRKVPVTLPTWVAYLGLPFLSVYFKWKKKRPLYTATALKTVARKGKLPLAKAMREFGYAPSPLQDTVQSHISFLAEHGMLKLPELK